MFGQTWSKSQANRPRIYRNFQVFSGFFGSIWGFHPPRGGILKKPNMPFDRARRVLSWSTLGQTWSKRQTNPPSDYSNPPVRYPTFLFLTFSHFVFFLFFLIFNIKFVSSPLLIHSPVSMYLFYLASFSYPIWSLRQSSCLSILLHSRLSLALLHSYIAYEIELTYSLIHFLVFSHFFFPVFLFLDLVWNLWQSRCLFVLSHEGDCDNENLLASNAMNHDCCQPASVYINLTNWYNLSHFDQHPTTKNSCSSPISINIQ